MNRMTIRQIFLAGLAAVTLITMSCLPTANASDQGTTRIDGEIAGAPYTLMRPDAWNGDLVLLVHGSIANVFEGLAPGFVAQGYGVAFTTLPPGLGDGAALRRIPFDTRRVKARFTSEFGKPARTYLVGFSRGAHAMQRLLEKSPLRFDGMLSLCGGDGGSLLQWDHFFTARILFDHYFPGVLPGNLESMPPIEIETYLKTLAGTVFAAAMSDIDAAKEMAAVEQFDLPYTDDLDLAFRIVESLAIHSVGVNDLLASARGMPFDNSNVYYTGTSNDADLNANVARLVADPQARNYLRNWYEPSGSIGATPVMLVHNVRDGIVPNSAHDKYEALVNEKGYGDYLVRRVVDKAGHCEFSGGDIFFSFAQLVAWAETGIRP